MAVLIDYNGVWKLTGDALEVFTFTRCRSSNNCQEYYKLFQDLDPLEERLIIAELLKEKENESRENL